MLLFALLSIITAKKGGLRNKGQNCWEACGRSGRCNYCGTGKCCRQGYNGGEYGCGIKEGGVDYHTCVKARVLHLGEDCYYDCNETSGSCNFCGTGRCCRKGWNGGEKGCGAKEGGVDKHVCIKAAKRKCNYESPTGKCMKTCPGECAVSMTAGGPAICTCAAKPKCNFESPKGKCMKKCPGECAISKKAGGPTICTCAAKPKCKFESPQGKCMKKCPGECAISMKAGGPTICTCAAKPKPVEYKRPCCNKLGAINPALTKCARGSTKVRRTYQDKKCWKDGKKQRKVTCPGFGYDCVASAHPTCCSSVGRRRAVVPPKCGEGYYLMRDTHEEKNCVGDRGKLMASMICPSPGWTCTDRCPGSCGASMNGDVWRCSCYGY